MTFDEIVKLFADAVKSTEIRWRDTMYCDTQYYYAEERLYLLRTNNQGHYDYTFTYANDPQEAALNAHNARYRPVIVTKNGWHIDQHGNRWDADKFTAEQAENYSRYMRTSFDCINCMDCIKCVGCVSCSNCRLCYSCIGCYDCVQCTFLIKCYHCRFTHDKSSILQPIYYHYVPENFGNLIDNPESLSELFIRKCDDGKWFSHFCKHHYNTEKEAKSETFKALKKARKKMQWFIKHRKDT